MQRVCVCAHRTASEATVNQINDAHGLGRLWRVRVEKNCLDDFARESWVSGFFVHLNRLLICLRIHFSVTLVACHGTPARYRDMERKNPTNFRMENNNRWFCAIPRVLLNLFYQAVVVSEWCTLALHGTRHMIIGILSSSPHQHSN